MKETKELLTNAEAAELLGVSKTKLHEYVKAGLIKRVSMPTSTRKRIKRVTLLQFIDSLEESAG